MGDEIASVYTDADIVGVASFGGIFDVEVDGEIVFSKDKEGRFPIDGELVKRIKELEYRNNQK